MIILRYDRLRGEGRERGRDLFVCAAAKFKAVIRFVFHSPMTQFCVQWDVRNCWVLGSVGAFGIGFTAKYMHIGLKGKRVLMQLFLFFV